MLLNYKVLFKVVSKYLQKNKKKITNDINFSTIILVFQKNF